MVRVSGGVGSEGGDVAAACVAAEDDAAVDAAGGGGAADGQKSYLVWEIGRRLAIAR